VRGGSSSYTRERAKNHFFIGRGRRDLEGGGNLKRKFRFSLKGRGWPVAFFSIKGGHTGKGIFSGRGEALGDTLRGKGLFLRGGNHSFKNAG